jgi:hypothetical protein
MLEQGNRRCCDCNTNNIFLQKKSSKGRENASKNIHPHRMGSGGYETTMLKWKESDVVSMGESSTVINSSTDERSFTWLRARAIPTETEGVFIIPNPATQHVFQRVVCHFSLIFSTF